VRILLCLNRDLMSNLALNLLRPALAGHSFEIVLSLGIGKKGAPHAPEIEEWGRLEHRIVECGLFAALDAQAVQDCFQTFARIAQKSESGFVQTFANINIDGLDPMRRFAPDVIVSIRFGQIFKPPLIALPRLGILNLHSGLLPEYRGVLATFWAMLQDAPHIGCTLHRVSDGTIDTGAIAAKHAMPPDKNRSLLWNIASLYDGGAGMIASALEMLTRGEALDTVPQDDVKGRYFTYPESRDIARFLAKGLRLYSAQDYAAIFARYGYRGAANI
jgi:methionyl-tRNA formyltransferase